MTHCQPFDVAIIGGGIAGLSVALRLPEHVRVALFTKGQFGESNTRYAQGGLAVALGADDSPEHHFQDTVAAGAGLCEEEAVRILVEQAPAAVHWLMQMGVQFDYAQPGRLLIQHLMGCYLAVRVHIVVGVCYTLAEMLQVQKLSEH